MTKSGHWLRVGLAVGLLSVALLSNFAARATAAAERKLIYHQANETARTSQVLANARHIDGLPFDGITLNIPASWDMMKPGVRLTYKAVYNPWLAPLKGKLSRVTENFVLVVIRHAADPFDDWSRIVRNWVVLARAARDAGLKGILFDNEEYFERLWTWPRDVKYPSRSLASYAAQYRTRGAQLMEALRATWPEVKIIVLHGPYVSEPRTPKHITKLQTMARANDLRGHFFVGMLQGSTATARVIDGGEIYQYRIPQDFARSYQWRKQKMARLTPSALIPSDLRANWAARSSIAYGVYDVQWKRGYPMSPSILQSTLKNALAHSDRYVWLYTDGPSSRNYLVPGGASADWIEAIRAAKTSAR